MARIAADAGARYVSATQRASASESGGSSRPSVRTRATTGLVSTSGGASSRPMTTPSALRRPNSTITASPALEVGEALRHVVGVRPVARGPRGIDRDLDPADGVGPRLGRDAAELGHVSDADPSGRVVAVRLRDEPDDIGRGPVHLAGRVLHHVVVVLAPCELDCGVALADLELVGALGRPAPQAPEERLAATVARGR